MADKKININFHQTFKPETRYICEILNLEENTWYSLKDISSLTGIPNGESSGKVEPHLNYAKYMGLLSYEKENGLFKIEITKIGKIILAEDPTMQEVLSTLLCHCMICDPLNGADMWQGVFNNVLSKYRTSLEKEMIYKEIEFLFPEKANKKNISPFINSYEDMFYQTGLLTLDEDFIYLHSHMINKEFIYLYAFVLFYRWENLYPENDEISSDELKKVYFKNAFLWSELDEYKVLELLSDKGIIRLNRQLMPYTILKLYKLEEILEKLYSELF